MVKQQLKVNSNKIKCQFPWKLNLKQIKLKFNVNQCKNNTNWNWCQNNWNWNPGVGQLQYSSNQTIEIRIKLH